MKSGRRESAAVLAQHSRSFALAGRLFPPGPREDAAAVYAWCRVCDDAVDLAPGPEKGRALDAERARLALVYAEAAPAEPILRAFQEVVQQRLIPRCYPEELLAGLAMDAAVRRYETLEDLRLYSYRVAGTVGLMMCHVMGVSDPRGLRHAAHLGMAMQLTNIARDVLEDWGRGHLYLPDELLGSATADALWAECRAQRELPRALERDVRRAVAALLAHADQLYRSGDEGMRWLSGRCALSVRTARHVYAEIGARVAARGCDVWQGRAVVSGTRKLALVGRAILECLLESPARALSAARHEIPRQPLPYSRDLALD